MKKYPFLTVLAVCLALAAGCASKKERLTVNTLTIGIDSAYASVAVGGTLALKAVCRTPQSNDADVTPAWTIDAPRGSFSPATGKSTTFTATSTGTAVIRATVSDVSAAFAITVVSSYTAVIPAPTGLSVTAGTTKNTITWNAVSGAASYNIYWQTSSGLSKTTATKIPNAVSPYAHTGLTNGTAYYYAVTAVDASGNESDLSTVSLGTPATAANIYGLYSETYAAPTYTAIKLDTLNPSDADGGWLGAWGSAVLSSATGANEQTEGTKGLKCVISSTIGGWWIQFGYDGSSNPQIATDMSAFGSGYIKFDVRTPADFTFKVESSGGNKELSLNTDLGVALDNQWHSVSIPVANLTGVDLTRIKVPAGFHAGVNTSFTYYIDNVRWEK